MSEITLTFPDGAKRSVPKGTTGKALAESIAKSLAKRAVAMVVDGKLADLADPITSDASVKIVSRTDPEALELIRHDAAHVMAEAVQSLWPGTQVTIGPVIENGFYYDFAKEEPFHPDDLAGIEAKMHEIIGRNAPFTKDFWSREQAKDFFKKKGELFKIELVDAIPQGEDLKIYKQGEWLDLCRGPHMTSTGQVGKAFKLTKFAGSYWRGDHRNPQLQRIYGTAWATEEELAAYLRQIEEAEKRDHRKLGREMDLFHFQEEGPGVVFWHPKGWELFQNLIGYMRRRQNAAGYREVNGPQLLDKSLDPETGLAVTLRVGRFGPYVQLGEGSKEEKPKRSSVPKGIDPNTLDLERALQLLSLPRVVGNHPETGHAITAGLGRYGPFILHDGTYANLPSVEEVFSVGINRAVVLLAEKKAGGKSRFQRAAATVLKDLGEHPSEGGVVQVLSGRYGPYVKHGKVNATLPRGKEPAELTMDEAVQLIAERAAKGPGKPKARRGAKSAAAKEPAEAPKPRKGKASRSKTAGTREAAE